MGINENSFIAYDFHSKLQLSQNYFLHKTSKHERNFRGIKKTIAKKRESDSHKGTLGYALFIEGN